MDDHTEGAHQGAAEGTISGATPLQEAQPVDTSTGPDDPTLIEARGDRYLTLDQLKIIDDQLTMGDTWKATVQSRAAYPEDADLARRASGMMVFHIVARRIGLIGADVDLDAFMDMIRQDDFLAVLRPEQREAK